MKLRRWPGRLAAAVRGSSVADELPRPQHVGLPAEPFESVLPDRHPASVVILAASSLRTEVTPWVGRFSGDDLHVLSLEPQPEWNLDGLQVPFHRVGSLNAMAGELQADRPGRHSHRPDVGTPPPSPKGMETALPPGGRAAACTSGTADRGDETHFENAITSWYANFASDATFATKADQEIVDSTSGMLVTRDLVVVSKRRRHLLKVRHDEAHKILSRREPDLEVQVLESQPAGDLTSASQVHHHGMRQELDEMSSRLSYPELYLRRYTGRIHFLGSGLFYSGGLDPARLVPPPSAAGHRQPQDRIGLGVVRSHRAPPEASATTSTATSTTSTLPIPGTSVT